MLFWGCGVGAGVGVRVGVVGLNVCAGAVEAGVDVVCGLLLWLLGKTNSTAAVAKKASRMPTATAVTTVRAPIDDFLFEFSNCLLSPNYR